MWLLSIITDDNIMATATVCRQRLQPKRILSSHFNESVFKRTYKSLLDILWARAVIFYNGGDSPQFNVFTYFQQNHIKKRDSEKQNDLS